MRHRQIKRVCDLKVMQCSRVYRVVMKIVSIVANSQIFSNKIFLFHFLIPKFVNGRWLIHVLEGIHFRQACYCLFAMIWVRAVTGIFLRPHTQSECTTTEFLNRLSEKGFSMMTTAQLIMSTSLYHPQYGLQQLLTGCD